MWQLFPAAVAASTGLLAEKHIFFEPTAVPDHNAEPSPSRPQQPLRRVAISVSTASVGDQRLRGAARRDHRAGPEKLGS
ncbi:hypothetical protein FF1_009485 [Malus domestica]